MQGAIMTGRTRKGRKRKEGRRLSNGHLAADRTDIRGVVLAQPHRIRFAAAHRSDQRAESYLGSLNLEYRIHESANAKAGHSGRGIIGVTDHQYLAGQKYAGLVARYLAMCNAPRLAQPQPLTTAAEPWREAMRKPSVLQEAMWRINREADYEALTDRYMRAYEAVSDSAGHAGHKAINRAVIQDQALWTGEQLLVLRLALDGLAKHFGIIGGK
jgi:hypothetical protein